MSLKSSASIALLTIGLSGYAYAGGRLPRPSVPEGIEAPDGYRVFLVGHAVGTQNYICAVSPSGSGVEWLFIGPQATIFDWAHRQSLTHFPSKNPYQGDAIDATWQHSRDTSKVWARRLSGSLDPSYVEPGAIEWLLLEVAGADFGPTGGDSLTRARYVQRVNTVGGVKPPAAECTPATLNQRKLVTYEADYYFYR